MLSQEAKRLLDYISEYHVGEGNEISYNDIISRFNLKGGKPTVCRLRKEIIENAAMQNKNNFEYTSCGNIVLTNRNGMFAPQIKPSLEETRKQFIKTIYMKYMYGIGAIKEARALAKEAKLECQLQFLFDQEIDQELLDKIETLSESALIAMSL